ncbi:MAG: hypothetical protein RJA22_309 [Verrucomicrobiota bacterium]
MTPALAALAAALALLLSGCATPAPAPSAPTTGGPASAFEFALIGDTPYDWIQETLWFPNLVAELNRARLEFVVHVGDLKSGGSPCTDALFERRAREFGTIDAPFVFLPGDNEWTDCDRSKDQPHDPLERLAKLRELFAAGDRSLGRRTMPLQRQSGMPAHAAYRENVRWMRGGVVFAGLNVPGADNHHGSAEFPARNAANLAWIQEAFAAARRDHARAIMLLFQANPHFDLAPTNRLRRGFNEMLALLEKETVAFGKPVVLVHGDTHYFRIDQPLAGTRSRRMIENFTRVETYGNPEVHWIHVTVDPRDPAVFTFRPRLVPGNRTQH